MTRSLGVPVAMRQNLTSRAKTIPATFHQRSAPAQMLLRKKLPRAPLILRTSDGQQPFIQETIFILRMPRHDASTLSPPEVWTLCVWRVSEKNASARQLQSAIAMSWI